MNYRHAYHAGNFADVFKHAALILLLEHLLKKDSAFQVIDTHAGGGFYDLDAVEAEKTAEFQGGIGRLPVEGPLPAGLAELRDLVARCNPAWPSLRHYPGSPHIARVMLRPIDRLTLVELHPEEVKRLRQTFRGMQRVAILEQDAYAALKAVLPPAERRGLVLIDPPFEVTDEFARMAAGLATAVRRWPTGIYAIWYPLKDTEGVSRFLGEIAQLGKPALTAELRLPGPAERLKGCGVAVLNPPWKLDQALDAVVQTLKGLWDGEDVSGVRWLSGAPEPESTSR